MGPKCYILEGSGCTSFAGLGNVNTEKSWGQSKSLSTYLGVFHFRQMLVCIFLYVYFSFISIMVKYRGYIRDVKSLY